MATIDLVCLCNLCTCVSVNFGSSIYDEIWSMKVPFLSDLFDSPNLSLQEPSKNIITVSSKLKSFGKKLLLWKSKVSKGVFGCSPSFGFSLFGVAIAQKYFPFVPIDFVSLLSFNLFHVFSRHIHPPSPWPSFFPPTWHRHLHRPFSYEAFFSPFYVSIPA